MTRKSTPRFTFGASHLRQTLQRIVERPAVENAIEHVRLRLAPTVAKIHVWCSKPEQRPRKKPKRTDSAEPK